MARQQIRHNQQITCAICLDFLKDPVVIPCGHIYCMSCIQSVWDKEDERKTPSCPHCKQTFVQRPVLVKNTVLTDLKTLKKVGRQAAPAPHCDAGPEDVACDVCTGRKVKAYKSCLMCLASYCEQHLQHHYDTPPLRKHKLVEPTKKENVQENICSHHDEVMKIFCRTDQQCICNLCSLDQHKDHNMVSIAMEMTERKRDLKVRQQQIQQRIQDTAKEVKVLQQELKAINQSAVKAAEDIEKIVMQLIHQMKERLSEVKQQIQSRQKTDVSQVKERQQMLEQEITNLRRKDADLDQLLQTEDHNLFLQNYPRLPRPRKSSTGSSCVTRPPSKHFKVVTEAVSKIIHTLENVLSDQWIQISQAVTEVSVSLLQPEPKTRSEFLKYSHQVTLDPNTANAVLRLSERNTIVTMVKAKEPYCDHLERFTGWIQVLSRESLTGRCYWEVKWTGNGGCVAVAYKTIKRRGNSNDCKFGNNCKSWSLECFQERYEFTHNNISTPVSGPQDSTVGVYLDHNAGILSFYNVSETMTLLHRVQTMFTEPLHAGLVLYWFGDSAEICELR